MSLYRRGAGKSWARRAMIRHCEKWGALVKTVTKDGLKTDYYDVLGKRWVFVSRDQPEQEKSDV